MTAVDVDALDKLREELARVTLTHRLLSSTPGEIECACGWVGPYLSQHQAEKLLPVVDRIATERAAAELEAAIVEISRDRDNCPNKVRRQGYGGALYVLKCRHAVALREPTS